jgi:multisubunit Na+/H+ antiporter MnhG subunit
MRRICVVLSVLVLLVGAFALGRPTPATAAQAGTPATSAGAGGDETLLAVTVARDQVPTGQGLVYIGRVTFAPGARQTCGCPDERGTVLTLVESGTFTFELERGGRIIRGATTATPREELASPGVAFTLGAGDAMVFPGNKRVEANAGTEPAVYLFALILAPVGPPAPDPSDVGERTLETLGVVVGPWPDLGSGPVAIALRRTALAPGASLAAPADGIQFVVPDDARIAATPTALAAGENGTTTNGGVESIDVLVLTIAPAGGDGTPQA